MEAPALVDTLSALAHERRLAVYRTLTTHGEAGMAAGLLADRLGVPPNALSSHLAILTRAGIVTKQRVGKSVIYRACPDRVLALSRLLVEG
jgi:ArsR family transcriptional regulator, arsenate/arsenite/antimonite-responsive transcriptional repressor